MSTLVMIAGAYAAIGLVLFRRSERAAPEIRWEPGEKPLAALLMALAWPALMGWAAWREGRR